MRYVRLVAVSDEYDTSPGLVVKGTPMSEGMMADRTGDLIAHDLLEHQNGVKAIGPIDDELEALGGIWQVRGRWGDMCTDRPSMYSPAENVASDITRMFGEIDGQDWRPRLLKYRTHRHDNDDDFREMIEIARRDIKREWDDWAEHHFRFEAYLDNALHLMRRGFRKAARRFGDRFGGINQFKAIQRAVKGAHIDFEGQEFRLAYGNGEARVEEIYEEYY